MKQNKKITDIYLSILNEANEPEDDSLKKTDPVADDENALDDEQDEQDEYDEEEDEEDEEDEEEDGWDESILQEFEEVIQDFDGFSYELKSCVRGSFTGCETASELAEYIRDLASRLSDCADNIENM